MFNSLTTTFYNPIFTPIWTNLSPSVTGTDGDDNLTVERSSTTNVDTFGGHDHVELLGSGDYNVELGSGNDKLTINGTGDVDAEGGDGIDRFVVNEIGAHHLDGGAHDDRLDFRGLDSGVRIDFEAGTAQRLELGPHSLTIGDAMTFVSIENVFGSNRHDDMRGSDQGDWFHGADGDDDIYGNGGDDSLFAGLGSDFVSGGDGNDLIRGGASDFLYGGAEDDTIYANQDHAADKLAYVAGDAGDDTIFGNQWGTFVRVGDGHDTFTGTGNGSDHIMMDGGDSGNDTFHGGGQRSNLRDDADVLNYSRVEGSVYINADLGIVSGEGAGVPVTTTGGPFTTTENFQDRFTGFEAFVGSNFDDKFRGADIADQNEWFHGDDGEDLFIASHGRDHFYGDDHESSSDPANAAPRYDTVDYSDFGGRVNIDLKIGEGTVRDYDSGYSWAHSYDGIEAVIGTRYNDTIVGNEDANRIEGRAGGDVLTGEGDSDTFVFDGEDGHLGYDWVVDFERGEDLLELANLARTDGQAINGFWNLDTNGDGVLDGGDTTATEWNGNMLLQTDNALVYLLNVDELDRDDFVFA